MANFDEVMAIVERRGPGSSRGRTAAKSERAPFKPLRSLVGSRARSNAFNADWSGCSEEGNETVDPAAT